MGKTCRREREREIYIYRYRTYPQSNMAMWNDQLICSSFVDYCSILFHIFLWIVGIFLCWTRTKFRCVQCEVSQRIYGCRSWEVTKWLDSNLGTYRPMTTGNQALSRSDQMYKYACTHGYKFGNLIRDSLPSWPNLSPELDPQREAGSPSFLQSHPIFQVVKVQKELGHLSILVSPASASAAL